MSELPQLRAAFDGRSDLLSLPVGQVASLLPDGEVADDFLDVAKLLDAKLLGDVVDNRATMNILSKGLVPPPRRRLLSALTRLAQTKSPLTWRTAPPASPPVEAPPTAKSLLQAWIKRVGVEPWLNAPVSRVQPFLQMPLHMSGGDHITVQELLEDRGAVTKVNLAMRDAYTSAAIQYLRYRAVRVGKQRLREETWNVSPPLPALRALAVRLKEALASLSEASEAPVFMDGSERLEVISEPPAIRMGFREGTQALEVSIGLVGYEHDALKLELTGTTTSTTNSAQVRAVLEWSLDIVHDPEHPMIRTLEHVLAAPSWTRFLDALAASVEPSAKQSDAERRLVWRLEPGESGELPTIQAAIQKRGKTGAWSAGAVTPLERIDDELLSHEDREVIECMGRNGGSPIGDRLVRTLLALVHHPRVFVGGLRIPVTLVSPTVALVATEWNGDEIHSAKLEIRVRGEALKPRDVERRPLLSSFDGNALFLAQVDDRLVRIAKTIIAFPLSLPKAALDRVLMLLPRLQPEIEIAIPHALRGERQELNSVLVARLTPDDETLTVSFRVQPFAGGVTWPAGRGPSIVFGLTSEGHRGYGERDLPDEARRHRVLRDELGLADEEHTRIEDLEQSLELLASLEARAARGECTIEWPERTWRRVGVAGDVRVRVRRAGDWLGVEGEAEVGGQKVALSDLLAAARAGKRFVQIAPGKFAAIEDDLKRRLEKIGDVVFEQDGQLAAGLAAAMELRSLTEDVAGDDWLNLLTRIESATSANPPVPAGLGVELRSYQREGFEWLSRLATWGAGACLADEMGLGKTVQALAVLLHRASKGPAIVIAPTSVCNGWEREAARFAPSLRVIPFRGPKRRVLLDNLGPGDILVTSYDVLARDANLEAVEFATMILDEAQALKNARTQRTKAAAKLKSDWRLALTGTPLENHLGELWSLFSIVSPGLLGPWTHFGRQYATPIERDGDVEKRKQLALRLRPFLLRRTKREVTPELPARTEVIRPIELSAAERAMYDAVRDEALNSLVAEQGDGKRFEILAALTKLRLLASHPRLVDASTNVASSKLASLLELIDDLRRDGHRTLIFSQFTSLLRIVRDAFDLRGITSLYLDGSTPAKKRGDLVDAWQEGNDPVFLISLKAGGTGLNLTAADTVIHLDPWWNPAAEDQASDRAHRIGQNRPVTIVRLVAQGTIEESVLALHDKKRALFQGVLDGSGDTAKLNPDELIALIRGESETD